jgi:hypothetical protein
MPKSKTKPALPSLANEPLKFAFDPDETLRRCATINNLPILASLPTYFRSL